MTAKVYRHPGLDRLTADDIRRRDAMSDFIKAEIARKRLVRAYRFWVGACLVGWATVAYVVIAWAQQ